MYAFLSGWDPNIRVLTTIWPHHLDGQMKDQMKGSPSDTKNDRQA